MVHAFEDGRGILNYEICEEDGACDHHDGHIHFIVNPASVLSVWKTFIFRVSSCPKVSSPTLFLSSSRGNALNVGRKAVAEASRLEYSS